jgi:hypothetical protein
MRWYCWQALESSGRKAWDASEEFPGRAHETRFAFRKNVLAEGIVMVARTGIEPVFTD